MFPASTHGGQAVLAFPDVCKTPTAGVPVPIAYPNIGTTTGTATKTATATKTPVATKTAVATKPTYSTLTKPTYTRVSGNEAGVLRGQLSALHQKLMTMPVGDTTQWHKVVDDYVITSAEVYKTLASD